METKQTKTKDKQTSGKKDCEFDDLEFEYKNEFKAWLWYFLLGLGLVILVWFLPAILNGTASTIRAYKDLKQAIKE